MAEAEARKACINGMFDEARRRGWQTEKEPWMNGLDTAKKILGID